MRPLERSLEKLDDVRRKKLSEMIMGSEGGTSTAASSGLCFCFGSCRDYISPFSIQICLMWCFLTLFLYILICQLQFKALALLHPLWRWVSCLQFRVQVSFVYDYTHCILVVMIPSINYPPWSPDNWMKLFQLLYSYFVCHFFLGPEVVFVYSTVCRPQTVRLFESQLQACSVGRGLFRQLWVF